MLLLKLLYLAVRAPAQKAIAGVPQINVLYLRQAPRKIESGRTLVCDAFTMREAVVVCRTYRRLVELLGIQRSPFDASDLGTHERRSGLKVLWAVHCPYVKLPMMEEESG